MTINKIKKIMKEAGSHWFDPDSMRFFRCRVSEIIHEGPGGIFFVSSEEGPHGGRRYTVRQFIEDYRREGETASQPSIETPKIPGRMNWWSEKMDEGFMMWANYESAQRMARKMAKG